jgi:hypothetical protein
MKEGRRSRERRKLIFGGVLGELNNKDFINEILRMLTESVLRLHSWSNQHPRLSSVFGALAYDW